MLVAGFLGPDVFPTLRNLLNITRQISLLAIIATGATVIMTVGEFDLSIGAMMGEYIIRWDLLTAGGVLACLPVVFFFTLVQKHLVQGLTAGAVKG